MSKIGRKPIPIPSGVTIKVEPDNIVTVKGSKGELRVPVAPIFEIKQETGVLEIVPKEVKDKKAKKDQPALWGLYRSLLANAVEGVSNGFAKKLELEGIGYRATLEGKKLMLNLGYSHPVEFQAPEGIEFKVEKSVISVSGISKELVGQVAAQIRALRPPEPYKGKGIHYLGEVIRRKAGKKAATAA